MKTQRIQNEQARKDRPTKKVRDLGVSAAAVIRGGGRRHHHQDDDNVTVKYDLTDNKA